MIATAARVELETRLTERVSTDQNLGLLLEAFATQTTQEELLVDLFGVILAAVIFGPNVASPHRRHCFLQ